tara:strand:+ start:5386 stop:6012 length:627 start_codon:yes stop_codon:yes gene_type:complete
MFEDIFSRRNIILKKLVQYFNDEFQDIIIESIIRIKDLELILKSILLFSNKNYFGLYSLDHKRKLINLLQEGKREDFIRFFTRYQSNFIKVNDLEEYLNLEILTITLFYEKCYYNIYYEINENNYLKCKKKIYQLKGKDIRSKYFYHRNSVMVKKGKSEIMLNLQQVIYDIIKNKGIEPSVKKYIYKFYSTEFNIVSDYLKYQKEIYF